MKLKIFIFVILAITLSGCRYSKTNTALVVNKYSSPPEERPWGLVSDTQEFWRDVDILYHAGLNGDPNSIRTIFIIHTFTDGAIAEGMPDLSMILKKHPKIVMQMISENAGMEEHYSHYLELK